MKMLFQFFYCIKNNWHIILGIAIIFFLAVRLTSICVSFPTKQEHEQARMLIVCLNKSDLLLNFFDERRIEKPIIRFDLKNKYIKFILLFSSALSDDDSREIANKIQSIVMQEKVKSTMVELEFSCNADNNIEPSGNKIIFYNKIINIRQ